MCNIQRFIIDKMKVIIARTGFGYRTATVENCGIHSDYPSPKSEEKNVGVETYTFTSNPGTDTTTNILTLTHGYSYRPMAIVYIEDVTGDFFKILPYDVSGGLFSQVFHYYTTTSQLKIDYTVTFDNSVDVNGRVFKFKYYVFVEDGL